MSDEANTPGKTSIGVLICDDDAMVRKLLRAVVESRPSFRVVGEAADGDEAIAEASGLQPDVILLDLAMPRRTGLDAIPELGRVAPAAKIIVLTGFSEASVAQDVIDLGAVRFLTKGASPDAINDAIEEAAAESAADALVTSHAAPRVARRLPAEVPPGSKRPFPRRRGPRCAPDCCVEPLRGPPRLRSVGAPRSPPTRPALTQRLVLDRDPSDAQRVADRVAGACPRPSRASPAGGSASTSRSRSRTPGPSTPHLRRYARSRSSILKSPGSNRPDGRPCADCVGEQSRLLPLAQVRALPGPGTAPVEPGHPLRSRATRRAITPAERLLADRLGAIRRRRRAAIGAIGLADHGEIAETRTDCRSTAAPSAPHLVEPRLWPRTSRATEPRRRATPLAPIAAPW